MPTYLSPRQRGAANARAAIRRVGDDLGTARRDAGLSLRAVGAAAGISHTQLRRIEAGSAPHVDVDVLARCAAVVGLDLSVVLHPRGTAIRDAAHVALLERFRRRISPDLRWRTEVPIPTAGDWRSADAVIDGPSVRVLVEAETRLHDIQAVERRIAAKQRDLILPRCVLLVLDSRFNRDVVEETPRLRDRFPVGTRAALGALRSGRDPGGDCLVLL